MHITKFLLSLSVVVLTSIISVNGNPASTKWDRTAWKFRSMRNNEPINELYKSRDSTSGNPFLYPCTSNSQCDIPGLNTCHMSPGDQPNTWFCDCYWSSQDVRCTKNKDCCTNICNNGQCATSGGLQGALCSPAHQDCASGYICHPWGDAGYCDLAVSTTTSRTTTTKKTTTATTKRITTETIKRTTTTTTRTSTTPLATCPAFTPHEGNPVPEGTVGQTFIASCANGDSTFGPFIEGSSQGSTSIIITCGANGQWSPSFSCVSCPSSFRRANPFSFCIGLGTSSCPAGSAQAVVLNTADLANYHMATQTLGIPDDFYLTDGALMPGPVFKTSGGQLVNWIDPPSPPGNAVVHISQCNPGYPHLMLQKQASSSKFDCCIPHCPYRSLCTANPQ